MAPIPPKPTSIIAQVAGSGTVSDTPSSTAIGGRLPGVPRDRNDRGCVAEVGVKNIVAVCQPEKPWLGTNSTGVKKVWPPNETWNCSVISPERFANWEAAQSKVSV